MLVLSSHRNFKTLESEKHMSMLDWYVALVRSKAAELLSH